MAPDSIAAVILLLGVAVLVAVATALFWDAAGPGRHLGPPPRWRVWVVRPLAVLLCLTSAGAAAVVIANRELGFFGTWRELVGLGPASGGTTGVGTVTSSTSGSRVVSFTVNGAASHLNLRAYAYLPPGYDVEVAKGERLPVLEMLAGFPGSPHVWLSTLDAPQILDGEIAAGRMAPTVVVFPYQTVTSARDTECVNAVGGVAMDTFLSVDVPATVDKLFQVRTDTGWGVLGLSTGGYCAVNLALRHPDRYAAAVSLAGNMSPYLDAATGDLFRGDRTAANLNNPLWRLKNLRPEPQAFYLATGLNDHEAVDDLQRFVSLARPPMRVTTAALSHTGHTLAAFRAFEAPAYDWVSSWLAGPAGR